MTNYLPDTIGLSIFGSQPASRRLYRIATIIAVVLIHLTLELTTPYTTEKNVIAFRLRIWIIFTAAVFTFILQTTRMSSIGNCHRKCVVLPPSHPFSRLLCRFLIFFTHFLIYQTFYPQNLFLQNAFYGLLLLFYSEAPCVQFEYLITSVRYRVAEINDYLAGFVNVGEPNFFTTDLTSGKNITKIHDEYMELMDLVRYITGTYSHQVLVAIGVLCSEMFYAVGISFFDLFDGQDSLNPILDFCLKTFVVLTLFWVLMVVMQSGHKYLKECKRTDDILCDVICTNPNVSDQIRLFAMQKITNPAVVSILGILELNHGQLYDMGCRILNFIFIIGMFYLGVMKNNTQTKVNPEVTL